MWANVVVSISHSNLKNVPPPSTTHRFSIRNRSVGALSGRRGRRKENDETAMNGKSCHNISPTTPREAWRPVMPMVTYWPGGGRGTAAGKGGSRLVARVNYRRRPKHVSGGDARSHYATDVTSISDDQQNSPPSATTLSRRRHIDAPPPTVASAALMRRSQRRLDFDSTVVGRAFDCLSKVIKVTVT